MCIKSYYFLFYGFQTRMASPKHTQFLVENVERVLDSKSSLIKAKREKPWILFNVLATVVLGLDVVCGQTLLYCLVPKIHFPICGLIEKALLLVFGFNSLTLIVLAIRCLFFAESVQLSTRQKKLLGINDDENSKSPKIEEPCKDSSTLSLDLSWIFNVKAAHAITSPFDTSRLSTKSSFQQSPPTPFKATKTNKAESVGGETYSEALVRLRRARNSVRYSANDSICNVRQLQRYLHKINASSYLTNRSIAVDGEISNETFNSSLNDSFCSASNVGFGLPQDSPKTVDFSLLVGQKYHVSPSVGAIVPSVDVGSAGTLPGSKAGDHSPFSASELSLWLKFKVDPENVDIFTDNIRVWISSTILNPVMLEIEAINEKLRTQHRSDLSIGGSNMQALQHLMSTNRFPSLHALLPYLDLTSDQAFLVTRLRELSRDSCMSSYCLATSMTAAATVRMESQTLTDFDIVLHFLCVYMNGKMPSDPLCSDVGAFTAHYFVKYPAKPKLGPNFSAIFRPSAAPFLQVMYENDAYDVGKGVNNLFRAFLLFVQIRNVNFDGRLGPLSLGRSGLNVLWTLDV